MQRIEGRESEAIGALKIMKDLSHELRRNPRMLRIPGVSEDQIVSASQFHDSIGLRLVEHDLWTRGVHDTVAHQSVVHIVKTHCPKVVSTHATEFKAVSFIFSF